MESVSNNRPSFNKLNNTFSVVSRGGRCWMIGILVCFFKARFCADNTIDCKNARVKTAYAVIESSMWKDIGAERWCIGGNWSVVIQEINIWRLERGKSTKPNIIGGRLEPTVFEAVIKATSMASAHKDKLEVKPKAVPWGVKIRLGKLRRWAENAVMYKAFSHFGVEEAPCFIN